jgi:hypothetical protein
MKLIQLAQGKSTMVDDQDYGALVQHRWSERVWGQTSYAMATIYFGDYKQKTVRMHRLIMEAPKGSIIDHVDGNGLNNQRVNLRFCTQSQNMGNMRGKMGTSKFKGVCLPKGRSKWLSQIRVNGASRFLGYFDIAKDAARAYDISALAIHGEFAKINFQRRDYEN